MKPTDADVMKIHEDLVILDGTAPLMMWGLTPTGKVEDTSGKGIDYYIQGGFTGAAASVSALRVTMDIVRNRCGLL